MKKIIQLLTPPISIKALSLSFFFLSVFVDAQTAIVRGKVVDEDRFPLESVSVLSDIDTVYTNSNGEYSVFISSDKEVKIEFYLAGKHSYYKTYNLLPDAEEELNVLLSDDLTIIKLDEVLFQREKSKPIGSTSLSAEEMSYIPSLTGGVSDLLKSLPSVSTNTELSSQYMVRGGNYDENLIYVNGMEVYKPQLIRSGEQEALGFVNPDMTQAVNFSAGGWEAKYGDKMSSVLDIIYKTPKRFEASAELSFMGGNITAGGASKNKKLSAIAGIRYQNRDLILNTLDGDSDFSPEYFDVQTNINYKFNPKWDINFLGTYSINKFKLIPKNRETKFGTLENTYKLTVHYDGREEDLFETLTGSVTLHHKPNPRLNLMLDAFGYHSKEREYFDIYGAYLMSEINQDGNAVQTYDVGSQIDHARNNFDIMTAGIQHRGKYDFDVNTNLEWGVKYQREDIRDLLGEWQYLDSSGYSLPNSFYPGILDESDLILNNQVNAKNELKSNRFSAYAQFTKKFMWKNTKVLVNAGLRAAYWDFNEELNISPRAQIALKPDWKEDMTFRFATGFYYQPPFYREVRTLQGELNKDVKSQQSIHFILGHDYEFEWMNRPFKLTSEVYYKILNDLNPYFVDNVRIRYTADNNADGYAYGIETRLFGEFVPGVDSWVSLSYAKAYQNIDGRGNIPMPTDPRFKVSIFFQDYLPILPSFKVNVNLIYASGLPNGAPPFTDPYDYQSTLSDYKRVDIGFVKEFINQTDLKTNKDFWNNFKELSLGLDVFNIFDIRNKISNTWIRDANTNTIYGVPNRLTGRFLNLKLRMKF